MFLASKIVSAGIVFVSLATGISGRPRPTGISIPRSTPHASGANLSEDQVAAVHENDAKQMQQSLSDKGHYRGKVDGAIGLRTRASIRAYQKAENLRITGQVDTRTADRLGVRPESNWGSSRNAGAEVGTLAAGGEITQAKPSAGIKWANGRGRTSKKPRKEVPKAPAIEDDREDGANKPPAESGRHDQ
ncbi:MAG: peptidoglycan-binding domain-containing protein [Candidatus Angelobacter sp.]